MIMAVKEDCGKIGGPQECAGCGKKIHDKFILKVTQDLFKRKILFGLLNRYYLISYIKKTVLRENPQHMFNFKSTIICFCYITYTSEI